MSDCYYDMWRKSVLHDCKLIKSYVQELPFSSLETTYVISQILDKLDMLVNYYQK